jgi:N4-gp56 family major capsid protein
LINVNINKHYEYSKLIEDIAEVQALSSMRKFYTDDAGHALATQVDKDLFVIAQGLNGGAFLDGAGAAYTGTGAAADITDVGIRAMLLKLDNADVPMDNRAMVIPPIAANDLLGQPRFTEQQFVGSGDAIKTGKIGMIYGVDIFISSNCPEVNTNRIGCLFHKDAMVLAEQVGVRSQTQYKQEYLGDLFTADTIYGVAELRDDAGIPFKVKAT